MPNAAVHDQSAAHTGAERKHADIVSVATSSQPLLAHGSSIGVVFQDHARAQPPLNFVAYRIIVPARQVGRLAQEARMHINDSGHSNANPRHLQSIARELRCQLANVVAHFVDYTIAPARHLRAGGELLQQLAVGIHDGHAQVRSAQVNRHCKRQRHPAPPQLQTSH